MFSKPLQVEKRQQETRKVSFCLEKNTTTETYPAKYIRRKEQIYPEDQEEKAYDRRTENSKGKYKYYKEKVLLGIQKHNYNAWFDIYEKEMKEYFKNKQIRKDILSSEQKMSIWKPWTPGTPGTPGTPETPETPETKTPPTYNTTLKEPLSSYESSEDDRQQD